jgi:hypothetical protein
MCFVPQGDMLVFVKEESLDAKGAETLIANSTDNPDVLLGWQVTKMFACLFSVFGGFLNAICKIYAICCKKIQVDDPKIEKGIYVVTDLRKNYMQKTEFRISKFNVDDQWIRLARTDAATGKSHGGLSFRPLRMVLYGLEEEG